MNLKCENCCYHYQYLDDDYPTCHWIDDGFPAPCEDDVMEEEIYQDEWENL